jgi:NodT family efflux transporter outer membrane factor (OMF) lipoprotein
MNLKFGALWGPTARVAVLSVMVGACGVQSGPYALNRDFAVPTRWSTFGQSEPRLIDSGWVESFRSPILNQLVHDAMVSNRDLRAAAARLAEAQALSRQAGAVGTPSVELTLGAAARGNGTNREGLVGGLNVSWEADLWGRIQGQRTAAGLDAVRAEAIFEAARQSLAAAVAVAWIDVNGNARALEIARQELRTRQALLNSVEQRIEAQAILAVEGNTARADVARARDRVAAAEVAVANGIRVLEVLTGRYPAGRLNVVTGLPSLPGQVPVGLPAQILERRPDIIAAERRVAAAFYRQGAAQAATMPSLSLSGNITQSLDPNSLVWTLVGNLFAPIFDGRRRAEEVNVANARQAEALALYGAQALTAFREVETAIADEQALRRRLTHLNNAVAELESAVATERQRFEAGELEAFRLNDVRVRYFEALRDANAVRVALLRNRVALHLALGGSFETRARVPEPVPVASRQEVARASQID